MDCGNVMNAPHNTTVPLPTGTRPMQRGFGLSRLSYRQQEIVWAYILLGPTLIGLFIFILGPFLASLALAFF
jgi:hypothetical protein